jgi:hypothetical protein
MTGLEEERGNLYMENEEKLIIAFILLLSISVSGYSITKKHLLDMNSYSEVLLAKNAAEGKSSGTNMLQQLTGLIYAALSSGQENFNGALLVDIAKILPVIFSAICALSFYFMLKQMFSNIAALGGAILLVSSRAFLLGMSSGLYYVDSLGMCAFILACSLFFLFYNKKNYLLLLASVILLIISAMNWTVPQGDILKEMNLANWVVHILNLPLMIVGIVAFVAMLAGRHKCKSSFGFFAASIFVLSMLLSLFDIFPSSFGVALFSAFALDELLAVKDQKLALAMFSVVLFFVSFEFSQTFLSLEQSVLASLLVAATSVFIASLYMERRIVAYITFSVMALLLFSSVSVAALTASQYVDRVGSNTDSMLEWANEDLPDNASIWAFGISPLIEFTTGRRSYANDTEFARFMLSNESVAGLREKNITNIVIDASLFDSIEALKIIANNTKVRIDSFRFFNYGTAAGNLYAVFVSRDGKAAWVPADPASGGLIDGDVIIIAGEGSRVVPLKKFLIIGNSRIIYPQDNYRVNLFVMFFEDVAGLKRVYTSENEDMKVYEVLG